MKKVLLIILIMTGVVIIGQQFVIKKDRYVAINPKELLGDLIDLEKRIPSLLHKSAELLEVLHSHIEACVDGDKQACTKKKDAQSKGLYKEHIVTVNNAITNLESCITQLVGVLKINNDITYAKGC